MFTFTPLYPYLVWIATRLMTGLFTGITRSFSLLTFCVVIPVIIATILAGAGIYQTPISHLVFYTIATLAGNLAGYSFSTRNEGEKK